MERQLVNQGLVIVLVINISKVIPAKIFVHLVQHHVLWMPMELPVRIRVQWLDLKYQQIVIRNVVAIAQLQTIMECLAKLQLPVQMD